MIITISGPPGSGKTTVGKLLAEKLGYAFISTGTVFREMARERGLALAEFGELARKDHGIDKELDRRILALAGENKKLVLEGRLAAHMLHLNGIPAFKVWIFAEIETRANRIAERENKPAEQVTDEILVRERCEHDRYRSIYDIDLDSLAVYDCVVHSDAPTAPEVADEILKEMEARNLV
jgi:cytidylate kinase